MFVRKLASIVSCLSLALTPLFPTTHAYGVSRMPSFARYLVMYDSDNHMRPKFVQPPRKPTRTNKDLKNPSSKPFVYMHGPVNTPPPRPSRVNAQSTVTAEERSRFYNLIAQTSLLSLGDMGIVDPVQADTYPQTRERPNKTPELGIYKPQILQTRFYGRHQRQWQPPREYEPRKRKS